jgi:hypothetical protein
MEDFSRKDAKAQRKPQRRIQARLCVPFAVLRLGVIIFFLQNYKSITWLVRHMFAGIDPGAAAVNKIA